MGNATAPEIATDLEGIGAALADPVKWLVHKATGAEVSTRKSKRRFRFMLFSPLPGRPEVGTGGLLNLVKQHSDAISAEQQARTHFVLSLMEVRLFAVGTERSFVGPRVRRFSSGLRIGGGTPRVGLHGAR